MMASLHNALQKYAKKTISLPKAPRFLLKLTLLPRVAIASKRLRDAFAAIISQSHLPVRCFHFQSVTISQFTVFFRKVTFAP